MLWFGITRKIIITASRWKSMVARKKRGKKAAKKTNVRKKPAKKALKTVAAPSEQGSSGDGLRSPQEMLDELHAEAQRERRLRALLSPIDRMSSRPSRKRKTPSRK